MSQNDSPLLQSPSPYVNRNFSGIAATFSPKLVAHSTGCTFSVMLLVSHVCRWNSGGDGTKMGQLKNTVLVPCWMFSTSFHINQTRATAIILNIRSTNISNVTVMEEKNYFSFTPISGIFQSTSHFMSYMSNINCDFSVIDFPQTRLNSSNSVFHHCHSAHPFRLASMPAVRYDLSGGLPTCLEFIMYQVSYLFGRDRYSHAKLTGEWDRKEIHCLYVMTSCIANYQNLIWYVNKLLITLVTSWTGSI